MRWLHSLTMVVALACPCCGQDIDTATARARAALALALVNRDAFPASDAKIKAAAIFKKCQEVRDLSCMTDLAEAIKQADARKKPLFILVGMTCHDAPDIHKGFPDAVWVHVGDLFNGSATPRLLVRPLGSALGTPFNRRDFTADTPARIRELLRQSTGGVSSENELRQTPFTSSGLSNSGTADC